MKEEYSSFKAVHHPDKIQELKDGKQIVPLQLQIVPSNICNQACSFCSYRMDGSLSNQNFNDRDLLPYDKLIETLDCCVDMGIPAIQVTGGGEPLVYKDKENGKTAIDMFNAIVDRNLELALVTNGQALNDEICQLLGEHSSWVRISIDAGNAETYSKIRGVSPKIYDRVIENIKTLVKYRKYTIIGIGFVVCKENKDQVLECAKLAKSLGVQNFRISANMTPEGFQYFHGWLEETQELCKEAEKLSDDNFHVFNLFGTRVQDNFEEIQDYNICYAQEFNTYLGPNLSLYRCCVQSFNNMGFIGSIKDQSLKELWNSQEKFDKFDNHCPAKHCKHPCLAKNKNLFLEYLTKLNPKHINFI